MMMVDPVSKMVKIHRFCFFSPLAARFFVSFTWFLSSVYFPNDFLFSSHDFFGFCRCRVCVCVCILNLFVFVYRFVRRVFCFCNIFLFGCLTCTFQKSDRTLPIAIVSVAFLLQLQFTFNALLLSGSRFYHHAWSRHWLEEPETTEWSH